MLKNAMIAVFLTVIFSQQVYAVNTAVPIIEAPNKFELPSNFRTTWGPLPLHLKDINKQNFLDLDMAGSGQFSEQQLRYVLNTTLEQLPKAYKIIIVDLRQEPHGFINGNAVSWQGTHPPANVISEAKLISSLTRSDLSYQHFNIPTQGLPSTTEIDNFINFYNQLPDANILLYFHDKQGKHRVTLFMALYDILWGAKSVSFTDIIERENKLSNTNLLALPAKNDPTYAEALAKAEFLKRFYQYAIFNAPDYKISWGQWRQRN